jgi:hypothetical protein
LSSTRRLDWDHPIVIVPKYRRATEEETAAGAFIVASFREGDLAR